MIYIINNRNFNNNEIGLNEYYKHNIYVSKDIIEKVNVYKKLFHDKCIISYKDIDINEECYGAIDSEFHNNLEFRIFMYRYFTENIAINRNIYIICESLYTLEGIFINALVSFITDRFGLSYTEVNDIEDFSCKSVEMSGPYVEILDSDTYEYILNNKSRKIKY